MPIAAHPIVVVAPMMAINAAAAHRRHMEHCRQIDQSFVSNTATAEQKREYASCVQELYPEPHAGAFGWELLALFAGAFVVRRRLTNN